ncbi:acyl-CoA thioesterase [Sulfitobacter sp. JB4-11]|uniref:acyl-CoA thioesterase n=1 Tax=Sulfitobacter rhodophyticola TaxID=3238304 RepID=UPI0035193E6E
MTFAMPQKVQFKHCDPAGIVFYPRYFEMINDCVEAFFDEALEYPFEEMHRKCGVPTAQIAVTFSAPSYHGDRLKITLDCTALGRTSVDLRIEAICEEERRFLATSTLVHIDENGRPTPWPDPLRARLAQHVSKIAA